MGSVGHNSDKSGITAPTIGETTTTRRLRLVPSLAIDGIPVGPLFGGTMPDDIADGTIAPHHLEMLAASGIPPEHAEARGYETITDPQRLADIKIVKAARDHVPGLLVPQLRVNGSTWGYQYRPDNPRWLSGKPVKYETPYKQRNGLDIPPGVGDWIDDPTVPLWVTEGVKKADCGAQYGLCIIALAGVWNWRGTNDMGGKTAVGDWNEIALNGRRVILAFDGDVARKPNAAKALCALADFLRYRDASVEYLHLPDTKPKTGLDDYLTDDGHTVTDLWALVRPTPPPIPDDDVPVAQQNTTNIDPDHPTQNTTNVDPDHPTWPAPDHPRRCAHRVVKIAELDGRPLSHWRDEWYRWCGTHYESITEKDVHDWLFAVLEDAEYQGAKFNTLKWKPTTGKLRDLTNATRGLVKLPSAVEDGCWLDGRDDGGHIIAFRNGLLRVKGRDRELLNHTPEYFYTGHRPVDYDPEATLVVGQNFLKDLTGGDQQSIDALLEFIGTRLVEDQRYQKAVLVRGQTGSGKGVFDRWVQKILGRSKHSGMRINDYARNGFPTEPFLGKSLFTFSDQRMTFNTKNFVDLLLGVIGGDEISVRRPYERRSQGYRMPLSFLFLTNEIPVWPDNSGAMQRRILAIESPNSFVGKEDNELEDALAAEVPALVNAVLDAYDRLCERGRFIQPETGKPILHLLRDNSSHLEQFVDECCDIDPDCENEKNAVYRRWKEWCASRGHRPTAENKFAADLYSLNLPGGQRITAGRVPKPLDDGSRPYTYRGLRLRAGGGGTLRLVGPSGQV